ncbi:MAG: hypothetical protein ACM3MI_15325 [Clostridiales bacterium]
MEWKYKVVHYNKLLKTPATTAGVFSSGETSSILNLPVTTVLSYLANKFGEVKRTTMN